MVKRWTILNREVVFKKYSRTIERRTYKMQSNEHAEYYIVVQKPGVCVLAITPDKKVVTARQYRPGPDAIFRELPGGFIDENEPAEVAALRELREETGFSGDVQWIGSWNEDATTDRKRYIAVVVNCQKVAEQNLENTEFVDIALTPLSAFIRQVRKGELTDAAGALLGLDHLGLLANS